MSGDATGNGQHGTVYQPTGSPGADTTFQSFMQELGNLSMNGLSAFGGQSPFASTYPGIAQAAGNIVNNPFQGQAIAGAQQASAIGGAGANADAQGAGVLGTAAGDVLNTAFDPQNALFNRTQQQALDQSSVANSMAGIGSTPYGASVTGTNLGNFDVNWQAKQLANQQGGLGAAQAGFGEAGNLYNAGTNLATQAGAAPYNAYNQIQSNDIAALTNQNTVGNTAYNEPNQLMSSLMQYLGVGQNAALAANTVQNTQFGQSSQIGQGIAGLLGLGSGIGNIGSGKGSSGIGNYGGG
jgi:hypothetical protein